MISKRNHVKFALLCCSPSLKKQKLMTNFFRSMYNKTIIRFGFCDIQNNRGLGKGYQPQPSALADNPYLDLDYSGYHKNLIQKLFINCAYFQSRIVLISSLRTLQFFKTKLCKKINRFWAESWGSLAPVLHCHCFGYPQSTRDLGCPKQGIPKSPWHPSYHAIRKSLTRSQSRQMWEENWGRVSESARHNRFCKVSHKRHKSYPGHCRKNECIRLIQLKLQ